MAYLNEFPHVEANKLNLDWILEQYSTFDKRLQELHDHFDEAVATFETELESFKHDYEEEFANYKLEVQSEIDSISNAIEQISDNVSQYVSDHMSEWQLESMVDDNNDVIIGDYDPEEPVTDGGYTEDIIINQTKYKLPKSEIRTFGIGVPLADLENSTWGVVSTSFTFDATTCPILYEYIQKALAEGESLYNIQVDFTYRIDDDGGIGEYYDDYASIVPMIGFVGFTDQGCEAGEYKFRVRWRRKSGTIPITFNPNGLRMYFTYYVVSSK